MAWRIEIKKATKRDMPYIREKIRKYWLDGKRLSADQFFVAKVVKKRNRIAAFGRIIDHGDFFELASLGVDFYYRGHGRANKMMNFMIKEAKRKDRKKEVFGVTHIPKFISKFGFKEVKSFPEKLEHKRKKGCKLSPSKIKIMKLMK